MENQTYKAFRWFVEVKLKEIFELEGILYTNYRIKKISICSPHSNLEEVIEKAETLFYEILVEFENNTSQKFLLIGPLKDGTFIVNGNLLIFQNELKDEPGIYFIKKKKEDEKIDKDDEASESPETYYIKIISDDFNALSIKKQKGKEKIEIGKESFDLKNIDMIENEIINKFASVHFSMKTLQKINAVLGVHVNSSSLVNEHIKKMIEILKSEDKNFFKEENPSDISSKRIFHFGCFLENLVKKFLDCYSKNEVFYHDKENILILFSLFSFLNECILNNIIDERKNFTFIFPTNPLHLIAGALNIYRFCESDQEHLPKNYRDVSESQKGILCPYETPESKLIGLSLHFLPDVKIKFDDHKLIPGSDKKILGVGASLIPFVNFNDGVRISMASKNMKQALPLENPEVPYVKTGMESEIYKFITPELRDIYFGDFFDKNSNEFRCGINALVAYMPYRGYNFDDAIVVSESFSKRCAVIKYKEYKEKVDASLYEIVKRVNEKEIIKKGEILWEVFFKPSEVCCKKETAEDDGEIINFKPFKDELIESIYIKTKKRHDLQVGDKLMNRHANKGVISRIVKDEEMPHLPDGTPVDVILNPMGIITRMNTGQILETHFGFVHWFYNRFNIQNFEEKHKIEKFIKKFEKIGNIVKLSESDIEELKEVLKIIGNYFKSQDPEYPQKEDTPPGKLFLRDGKRGEYFKYPVLVGSQYIMVLNHLSEDKIWARGFPEEENKYDRVTGQPLGGRAVNGGQRIGEMEVWSLLVHRSFNTLTEIFAIDNKLNRDQIRKEGRLKNVYLGDTFKAFCYYLKGLTSEKLTGVDTEFIFKDGTISNDLKKEISVADVTKIRFKKLSLDNINNSIKREKIKEQNFEGAIYRCSECAHVENRYIFFISSHPPKSLKLTNTDEAHIVCLKCWNPVRVDKSGKKILLECKCASKTELVEKEKDYLFCKEHNKKLELLVSYPSAYHILFSPKIFSDERHSMAKINNKIPVIPPVYRAEYVNRIFFESIGKHELTQAYKHDEVKEKFKEFLQPKEGFLREKLLKRNVNMSGRAVIVPDPELQSIDECSLPLKILEMFFEAEIKEWKKQYKEETADRVQLDAKIKKRLMEYLFNKKFILIRQPSLHKFNVLAFRCSKIREDNVIGINPLVCKGYNADFDGDQMAVFIPLTEEAQMELNNMVPSKNFYSPTGDYMFHIEQDMVIGFGEAWENEKEEVIKNFFQNGKIEDIKNRKAKDIIKNILDNIPHDESKCEAAQKIMQMGFEFATKYPVSFSYFDLYELSEAMKDFVEDLNKFVEIEENPEKIAKVEDRAIEKITSYINKNPSHPVLKFIATGSRGKPENIKQMCLFKGLVWNERFGKYKPQFFIRNFLTKGLTDEELFYVAFLARDNLGDKKLTVAKAGDITRNLVEALYEMKITEKECGCPEEERGIDNCKFDRNTICERCFKKELEKEEFRKLKNFFSGDLADFPIGILTAQTIGERATQLSMQAYHTGKKGVDIEYLEDFLAGKKDVSELLANEPYKNYEFFFRILARRCEKEKNDFQWRLKKPISSLAGDIFQRDILSVMTYKRGVRELEKEIADRELEVDFSTLKSRLIINKWVEKREKTEPREQEPQTSSERMEDIDYEKMEERERDEWDEFGGADEVTHFRIPLYRRMKKSPTLIIRNDAITWINLNFENRKRIKYIFESGIELFNKIKNKKTSKLTPPPSSERSTFSTFKDEAVVQIDFNHKKLKEFYKEGRAEEYEKIKIKLHEILSKKEIKAFERGQKGYSSSDLAKEVFNIESDDAKRKKIEEVLREAGIPVNYKDRWKKWKEGAEGYLNLLRRLKDE